jgi:hypothetical protein
VATLADRNPGSTVTGIDIAAGPIFERTQWLVEERPSGTLAYLRSLRCPPNVTHICDDFNVTWIYEDKFDYVRFGHLLGHVGDWPFMFQEAYKYVRCLFN